MFVASRCSDITTPLSTISKYNVRSWSIFPRCEDVVTDGFIDFRSRDIVTLDAIYPKSWDFVITECIVFRSSGIVTPGSTYCR